MKFTLCLKGFGARSEGVIPNREDEWQRCFCCRILRFCRVHSLSFGFRVKFVEKQGFSNRMVGAKCCRKGGFFGLVGVTRSFLAFCFAVFVYLGLV